MFRLLILAVPLLVAFRPPVEEPRLQPNGWHYGEAGNYCVAIRELPGGARLMMRLAKWDDLSDSLILWKPGLAPLDEEDEAAAERDHDLEVRIDGKKVEGVPGARMLADFLDKPGPSYRIGIAQGPYIAALAEGSNLEIRRGADSLAAFPIAGSKAMAEEMARCVEKDPSF